MQAQSLYFVSFIYPRPITDWVGTAHLIKEDRGGRVYYVTLYVFFSIFSLIQDTPIILIYFYFIHCFIGTIRSYVGQGFGMTANHPIISTCIIFIPTPIPTVFTYIHILPLPQNRNTYFLVKQMSLIISIIKYYSFWR
jgi:hypothetical protein